MDAQKQNEPLENKVAGESFAGKESVADDKKVKIILILRI